MQDGPVMCGRATHRAALGNCVTQIARPRLPFSVGDRKAYRVLADKVVGTSSAELAAYVTAEIPKWAALARQAGVKPE